MRSTKAEPRPRGATTSTDRGARLAGELRGLLQEYREAGDWGAHARLLLAATNALPVRDPIRRRARRVLASSRGGATSANG